MSEDRRLDVLRAIVTQYVHTREPVGSKVVAQSHDLGVSSATIRNDMAILEEAGLIYQPHTSAGRVPTDKGYRVFVDSLAALKPMSSPEKHAVEAFLGDSLDLDDVVAKTVRLLAQVTHQVAVVEYPSLTRQTLRRVELVDLDPRRILVIVVTRLGRVEERVVDVAQELPARTVRELRDKLNGVAEGLSADEVLSRIDELVESFAPEVHPAVSAVAEAVVELLRPADESKILVSGISNLARGAHDFHDLAPVLDALEEQVVLLRLFSELSDDDVQVRIGSENAHDALSQTSVVAGTYRATMPAGQSCAHLGVVGPTRMDYVCNISAVRAVAAYLSRFLDR